MKESISLARAFAAAGYRAVVATPHTGGGRPAPAEIITRLRELQHELDKNKITLKILPGSEQHIEPHTLELLKKKELLTLNGSRYFLLELPFFQPLPPYTEELIFNLTTSGYIPVIPHPERISALLQDPQLIFDLHQAGALFQVTWGALPGLLGPGARDLVLAMFRANLAHFFATDAHHAETRLLNFTRALRVLEEEAVKDSGDSRGQSENASSLARLYLFDRPRQLLKNLQLDLPPAIEFNLISPRKQSFVSRLRRSK